MDQESRKLIQEVTRVLQERKASPESTAPVNESDVAGIKSDLNTVRTNLDWHRSVGWKIVALIGAGFVLLLTLYIPGQISGIKDSLHQDVELRKQETLAATNGQFSAVLQQLAVMGATVELLKPDIQKRLGVALKNRATGKGAQLHLNLETAGELAKQALAGAVRTDPKTVGEAIASVPSRSELMAAYARCWFCKSRPCDRTRDAMDTELRKIRGYGC